MKKLTYLLLSLICIPLVCGAVDNDRSYNGWGASLAATTAPASIDIEQANNTNSLANGTFTDATGWATSALANGLFGVVGGKAQVIWTENTTQTMVYTFTDNTDPAPRKDYDVTFTLAEDLTATSGMQFAFGATNTGSTSVWYSVAGTYTERFTYASGLGNAATNFTMYAVADWIGGGSLGTITVDNVTIRLVPEDAWVGQLEAWIGPTDLPTHIYLDSGTTPFADAYAAGRTILVDSNSAVNPVKIDLNNTGRKISRVHYRTATGTATLNLRGW